MYFVFLDWSTFHQPTWRRWVFMTNTAASHCVGGGVIKMIGIVHLYKQSDRLHFKSLHRHGSVSGNAHCTWSALELTKLRPVINYNSNLLCEGAGFPQWECSYSTMCHSFYFTSASWYQRFHVQPKLPCFISFSGFCFPNKSIKTTNISENTWHEAPAFQTLFVLLLGM